VYNYFLVLQFILIIL